MRDQHIRRIHHDRDRHEVALRAVGQVLVYARQHRMADRLREQSVPVRRRLRYDDRMRSLLPALLMGLFVLGCPNPGADDPSGDDDSATAAPTPSPGPTAPVADLRLELDTIGLVYA